MGLSFFKSVFSIQVILDCILSESSEPQWCKNRREDTFYSDNLSSVNTYGVVKSSFVGDQSFLQRATGDIELFCKLAASQLFALEENIIWC